MKDILVVTPEFYKLWMEVAAESTTWNAYSKAMRSWTLIVQRVLYDAGYDAMVYVTDDPSTEVYQRIGPDQHDPLGPDEVNRIERVIQTVTLDAVLMD
jgi:hypothetical protein